MSDSKGPLAKKRKSELLAFANVMTSAVEGLHGKLTEKTKEQTIDWVKTVDGKARNTAFSDCIINQLTEGQTELIRFGDYVRLSYDKDDEDLLGSSEGIARITAVGEPMPQAGLRMRGTQITYQWLWSYEEIKKDLESSGDSTTREMDDKMRVGEYALGVMMTTCRLERVLQKTAFSRPLRFGYDSKKCALTPMRVENVTFDRHVENYRDFLYCSPHNRFKTTFGQRLAEALLRKTEKWEELYACHKPFERMAETEPGTCWMCKHASPLMYVSSNDAVEIGKACYEKTRAIDRIRNMIFIHANSGAMGADQKESFTKDRLVGMYADICATAGLPVVPSGSEPDVPKALSSAVNAEAGCGEEKEYDPPEASPFDEEFHNPADDEIEAYAEDPTVSSSSSAAAAASTIPKRRQKTVIVSDDDLSPQPEPIRVVFPLTRKKTGSSAAAAAAVKPVAQKTPSSGKTNQS